MSHFYPLTSVSQTGYEVIDENMDGLQPARSPANLLLSLVSHLPPHFPVIHQPPGDNGSKITNYLLQWDEVRGAPDVQHATLMLLFKLLRPISQSSPPPSPLTSSGVFSLQGKKNSVFRECYFGSQRHCKLTRLYPACGYTFRVAAHNDIGARCSCCNMFMSADGFDFGNLSPACDVIEQLFSGMGLFRGHRSFKSCNGWAEGARAHPEAELKESKTFCIQVFSGFSISHINVKNKKVFDALAPVPNGAVVSPEPSSSAMLSSILAPSILHCGGTTSPDLWRRR